MKKGMIYYLLILAISVSLKAQDSLLRNPKELWTLESCIEYARHNNITINNLRLSRETGEQNVKLSKSAFYPDLNASAGTNLLNSNNSTNVNTNIAIGSSLRLFNGNYLRNDAKAKELSLIAADLNIATAENDISLQITQAYLNILLSSENIKYLEDLVKTSQVQVIQAEQKNKTGTLANKDLMQLQSSLMNDKYNLVMAENNKRQNILSLKQLLQLPSEQDFEIAEPDTLRIQQLLPPLSDVEQYAINNMPQVRGGHLSLDISDLEIKKVSAGLLPDINLNGSLSSVNTYSNSTLNGGANSYLAGLGDNFNQQIGLSLTIPVSNRKTNQVNIAKAKIQKAQAELSLRNDITNLSQDVERSFINVVNAKSQFAAAEEQLKYSRELYRIANEQLKIGLYNNVEYLQQKDQYLQALQSYTQAKYACILYQKIYNFYYGVPVTQ